MAKYERKTLIARFMIKDWQVPHSCPDALPQSNAKTSKSNANFHPFEQAFDQALSLKRESLYTVNTKNQGKYLSVHYIPKGRENTSVLYISKLKTDRKTHWWSWIFSGK